MLKQLAPLAAALFLFSCGGGSDGTNAISTPLDSTKLNGTAPVQYGAENPANDTTGTTGTNENVIQQNDGLSNRRTQSGVSDGPVSRQKEGGGATQNRAEGTGTNTSNTTDARTTTGSAQGSDPAGTRPQR